MTNPIDLHVISPDPASGFLSQCLDSLQPSPINLFQIPENGNSIGKNRKLGYSFGTAEFKSHADYDDLYYPTAFHHALSALKKNPTASLVYTEEIKFDKSGVIPGPENKYDKYVHRMKPSHVHGLIIYRSSVIESAPESVWDFSLVDWAMTLWASTQGPLIKIPHLGRYWRQHPEQLSSTVTNQECAQVRKWFDDLVSSLA